MLIMPENFIAGPFIISFQTRSQMCKDDGHTEAAVIAMAGKTGHGLISTDNPTACSSCVKIKLILYSPGQALMNPGG
jgi:hypothetical protein